MPDHKMPPSKAYIISGMHRSGTSLIASLLQSGGIQIGDRLLGSNQSNSLGHYEDLDFLSFHQQILGEENRDGLKLELAVNIEGRHADGAKVLIEQRSEQPLWGWKDPRSVLFLDFWKEQMPTAKAILVYRHPIEVIISLIRRGTDFDLIRQPKDLLALWQHYNDRILQFKQSFPSDCVLCNLSGVTNDIDGFLDLIAQKTDIELDLENAQSFYQASKLIQYHWPEATWELLSPIMGQAYQLYQQLESLADIPAHTENLPLLNAPWEGLATIVDNAASGENEVLSSLSYLVSNMAAPSLTKRLFESSSILVSAQQQELDNRKAIITKNIESIHAGQQQLVELGNANEVLNEQISKLTQEHLQSITLLEQRHAEAASKTDVYQRKLLASEQKVALQLTQAQSLNNELLALKHREIEYQQTVSKQTTLLASKERELVSAQALQRKYREESTTTEAALDANKTLLEISNDVVARQSSLIEVNSRRFVLAAMHTNAFANYKLVKAVRIAGAIFSRAWGGYKTHPLFDGHWYKTNNPGSRLIHHFPYVHYCLFGWREGRSPSPFFDAPWYLEQNLDVLDASEEPLEHYVTNGWHEGRDPSPSFSTAKYLQYFPELVEQQINPLIHFVSNLDENDIDLMPYAPTDKRKPASMTVEAGTGILDQVASNGDNLFEDETFPVYKKSPVKIIAFYLPQFHPIPENDLFWGKGFTEWKNVAKAKPQFKGHKQPNLPGSLGFYDLRLPEVMESQARLAKQYGVEGFCFHYYWFNGRRVLERPIEQLLAKPDIDIQYCINWANENWTRSWDGKSREVLIPQNHTPQDDIDFINQAKRFFDDPRYIRVDSKPVLMLYNPTLLPDAAATAKRWREQCKKLGFEIFLLVAETHGFDSRSETWFDGLVEFPPLRRLPEDDTHKHQLLNNFQGNIFSYEDLANIHSEPQQFNFPVFKTVSPSWDNTARRDDKATIFAGSTPALYQQWLSNAIQSTICDNDESQRLVFVNAWNEWAEGAYLEPDAQYGYAYLNATAKALKKFDADQSTLIFTSHDTNLGGAQNLILTLLQWLHAHTNLNIKVVCASGGPLKEKFESLYPTFIVDNGLPRSEAKTRAQLLRFCGDKVTALFMNSVVSASLLEYLKSVDAPRILYAHELKNSIEKFYGTERLAQSIDLIDEFIGGSQPVIDNLIESYGMPVTKTSVLESFIVSSNRDALSDVEFAAAKQTNKAQLGLDASSKLVLACGMIEWRKGPDLFVDVAKKAIANGADNVTFIWIGPIPADQSIVAEYLKGVRAVVQFVGEKKDFKPYFDAADIFLLPSREDPFPLVCLEAADSELPIITFADNGGSPKFVNDARCGYVVPFEDTAAMAEKLAILLVDDDLRYQLGQKGHDAVLQFHSDKSSGPRALEKIRDVSALKPAVSIIVPAYNHGRFLRKRIESIYNQSFQDFEVILLDDKSDDETRSIFNDYRHKANTRICVNQENSGSPFKQWLKGMEMANADLIWIAEDDDYCEHNFLAKMLPLFDDPEVSLAYCQSTAIDESGDMLFSYMDYYKHEFDDYQRWQKPYKNSGQDEVVIGLGLINTIPNASAVLFRRFDTQRWQESWIDSVLAGDWAFYLHALQYGKVAYLPEHLNYHRRHEQTMTRKTQKAETRFNEVSQVHRDAITLYQVDDKTKARMREKMRLIWSEVKGSSSEKKFNSAYDDIVGP